MNENIVTETDRNQLRQFVRHTAQRTARAAEALNLALADGNGCSAATSRQRTVLQARFTNVESLLLDAQRLERQLAA